LNTLGLADAAIVVVASGFLDPSNNSNGPGFGLWVALTTGGNLIPLEVATGIGEANDRIAALNVWPNPANDLLTIDVETTEMLQAEVRLTDMTGRVVRSAAGSSLANGTNRIQMNVNGLAAGSYTLSVIGDRANRALPVQILR
jgi:hypothetical protein